MKLSKKLTLLVVSLTVGVGIISVVIFAVSAWNAMEKEFQNQVNVLARSLSNKFTTHIIERETIDVRETLIGLVAHTEGAGFSFLTDFEGRIFSHSFTGALPSVIDGSSSNITDIAGHDKIVDAFGKDGFLVFSSPLIKGMDSRLYMGFRKAYVLRAVNDMVMPIIVLCLIIATAGAVFAVVMSGRITRPLTRLTDSMQAFGEGKQNHYLTIDGKSSAEIAILSRTFNEMIDRRRKAEEELKKYKEHLEELVEKRTAELQTVSEQLHQSQKMEAIGQLAGGIAHDFNNRLTAIMNLCGILSLKIEDDNLLKAHVKHILTSAEKAAELTQGLLSFARRQNINPKPVNINRVIKNVKVLLERIIGEDIELKTILTNKDLIVMADSNYLENVLINLATNAKDAMQKGGVLTINTENSEPGEEFLRMNRLERQGPYAVISVSDTGMGMDANTKNKIFEPFFTTKELGKGTGLGLSTVYGIIKQHSGHIDIESEVGKGTIFRIYLPIVDKIEKESRTDNFEFIGGRETILLVDDNEAVRNSTKELLEEFGYSIIEAEDGEDALNKFEKDKDNIRLLILDLIMPKLDGKDVYERAKTLNPDIKALFMSGYAAGILEKKGMIGEEANFISKPIALDDLLKKIREALK